MKIQSVRLGHANNSSSTHSILLNSTLPPRESGSGDFQYGWDWFHLTDRESKSKYLATLVYTALTGDGMSPAHAGIIAKDLTAYNPMEGSEDADRSAYVDHQSVTVFPRKLGEKYLRHDFIQEFVAYVRDTKAVTIRGGNDNEDDPSDKQGPLEWMPDEKPGFVGNRSFVNSMPTDHPRLPLFGRKDKGWWTLYNKESGAKIRLSFERNPAPYLAASRPELVDVKITDFCPYGCSFCYQDSTKAGKHASLDDLGAIAYDLGMAEVFEVALGGGETTLHPEFPKVLERFALYGITPNFTTFNMAWTGKEDIVKAVKEHCKSFAVSNPSELKNLAAWNEDNHEVRGSLQIPLGCHPEPVLKKVLREAYQAHVPVTFLGYKDHGRGVSFKAADYTWILDFLTGTENWDRFGADTVFIDQFGDALKKRGVSERLMVSKEGAFSCYIDAVGKVMGPSSYTRDLHPMDRRNLFNRFPYASMT